MTLIAITALMLGTAVGFSLARRVMLRTLVGLILASIALVLFAAWTPPENLPGDGRALLVVAYLIAPPLGAGLFGGAVFAWLFRDRAEPKS